jgi:threonine/homoserine/homoserine lactone efflux protein
MPSLSSLLVFSGAALVLLVIPGPAVMYIVARSAGQGTRAGLMSVAGIHTGTVVHVAAAVLGLSAIVAASATAFTVVKLAGAAYLVYLGVRSLAAYRRRPGPLQAPAAPGRSMRRIFADAVVVNVLNPKTAIFFLAFVPQFVDVGAGHTTSQLLVLSTLFIGLGLVSDSAYAVTAGWIGSRLSGSATAARRKDLVAGTAYIGLGLVTAFSGAHGRAK